MQMDEEELAFSSEDDLAEGQNADDAFVERPRRSGRITKSAASQYVEEDEFRSLSSPVPLPKDADVEMMFDHFSENPNPTEASTGSIPVRNEDSEGPSNSSAITSNVNMQEPSARPSSIAIEIDLEDEEEEKPKPLLQLKYQSFSIFGHCLCIVVEPWPPIRSSTRAPSVVQTPPRAPSIAPIGFVPSSACVREQTPLFLPDDSDRDMTPAPFTGRREFPFVPDLDDSPHDDHGDSDSDRGGMMELSQLLNAGGNFRAGAVDDDNDMDGAVFFGDADEAREL